MAPTRSPRSRLGIALVLVVAIGQLLLVGSFVIGRDTLYLRDVLRTHGAFEAARAAEWQAGRPAPLDPYRAGGQPRWGNPNALPFYPTGVLQAIAPGAWSFNAHFWLHLLLAPWALAWLARRLGLGSQAATVAGAFYGFSGFAMSHLAFANLIPGAVLAPALAAAWLDLRRGVSRSRLLALAGIWGLLLVGGDPLYAGLALGMTLLVDRTAGAGAPVAPGTRLRAVFALAAGTLVAAPQIIELLRAVPTSFRGVRGFDAGARTLASWDPRQAVEWVLPLVFGPPDRIGAHAFWAESWHQGQAPLFASLAPGLLVLALAVTAGWRRPAARAGWTLVGAGLFLALGRYNPLVVLLADLPGLPLLRFPVKAWLLAAPGMALLGAAGWQSLFRDRDAAARRRVTRAIAGLCLLVLGLIVPPILQLDVPSLADALPPTSGGSERAAEVGRWGQVGGMQLLLGGFVLLLVRFRGPRAALAAGCAAVVLHVAFQVAYLAPVAARDRVTALEGPPRLAGDAAGRTWAHARNGALFGPPRVRPGPSDDARILARQGAFSALPFAGIPRGFRYELDPSPEGLDAFVTYLARDAVRALDDPARLRLLARWGVERLVLDRPLAADVPADLLRAGTAYGTPFYLYALPAVPPVRRVEGARGADTPVEALTALLDPAFDPAREVVLAGPVAGTARGRGRVEVTRDEPRRLELVTSGPKPGWVVVERTFHPLYRAAVNDVVVSVRIANLHRIAIPVPAGGSRVSLAFDLGPSRLAFLLSAVGLVVLGLLCGGTPPRVVSSASP